MSDGPTIHRERRKPAGVASPASPTPSSPHHPRRRGRTVKYAFDRVAAAVGIVLTTPLFVLLVLMLLALGVRRVLHVAWRIGEHGPIPLMTFALPPADTHPRVHRALTASGLVALPQLFNLLRGDLSLIGPRPRYPGEPSPPARPGMAGVAQHEQARRVLRRDEVFALDADYAARWSLGLDLRLAAGGVRGAFRPAHWPDRR